MLVPVKDDNEPKSTLGKIAKKVSDAVSGGYQREALRKASGNPPESYLKDAQSDTYNKTNGFEYKLPTK